MASRRTNADAAPRYTTLRCTVRQHAQLIRLIHDVIGVEILQIDGPDSRRPPPSSNGGGGGGFFGGARGIFGGGGGGGHMSGGDGGSGLEALSMPMMLQLRPSKAGLCNVRSKGGGTAGEDGSDASPSSLSSLTRAAGGCRGGGGDGSGNGTRGAGSGEPLAILASVQPLAKLSQLRYVCYDVSVSDLICVSLPPAFVAAVFALAWLSLAANLC